MFGRKEAIVPKIENRPSLSQLYDMYGYSPVGEEGAVPKEVLEIDWSSVEPKFVAALEAALAPARNVFPMARENFDHQGLKFTATLLIPLEGNVTEIHLSIATPSGFVSVFKAKCYNRPVGKTSKKVIWTLHHRFVLEKHRGQEIGKHMLSVLEKGLERLSVTEGRTQVIKIEARQLEVINFALKNGYKLSEKEDQKKLDLVFKGDRSKIRIATISKIAEEPNRYGYIFSVDELKNLALTNEMGELNTEQVWAMDLDETFHRTFSEYQRHALTINFEKEKNPKRS